MAARPHASALTGGLGIASGVQLLLNCSQLLKRIAQALFERHLWRPFKFAFRPLGRVVVDQPPHGRGNGLRRGDAWRTEGEVAKRVVHRQEGRCECWQDHQRRLDLGFNARDGANQFVVSWTMVIADDEPT